MSDSTKSLIKMIVTVTLVAALAIFGATYIRSMMFGSYAGFEVVDEMKVASDRVSFYNDSHVLAISSINGAKAIDGTGALKWEAAFSLDDPVVVSCKEVSAIADINGTSVYVIPESGIYTSYRTDYPIMKIAVSETGVTAVLLDKGSEDIIRVYDPSGKLRIEICTKTKQDGFPVDIALSEDGTKLATLTVSFDKDDLISKVTFYNSGNVGKNFIDNIVGQKIFEGRLAYDIEFLGNDTVGITLEDGFVLYEMEQIPELLCDIKPEDDILDLWLYNDGVSLVTEKAGERTLSFYGTNGKKEGTVRNLPAYEYMSVSNGEAVFVNAGYMRIYRQNGSLQFSGDIGTAPDEVCFGGGTRYFFVDADTVRTIKLVKKEED